VTDFRTAVDRAIALLERRGRVSRRALQLELELDDETLDVLCEELVDVLHVAEDSAGVLVRRGADPAQIERRLLTVLMCDLVEYTPLSEALDPEDLSTVMRHYNQVCNEVIARSGGHIATWIGDGVLVLYGYPVAEEDDAVRAVRCAYELVQAIAGTRPAMRAEHGVALSVRVGVDTGTAVVGGHASDAHGSTMAWGDTPNIAARVGAACEPDSCAITASTRELVESNFELEPLGEHTLKGVSKPVALYRVARPVESRARFESRARRGLSPLVGRTEECRLLRDACRAAREGRRSVLLLSGEPGIGKSRLADAARVYAAGELGMQVIAAECSPYLRNQALHPIAAALSRHWNIDAAGAIERVAADLTAPHAAVLLADVLGVAAAVDPAVAAMSAGRRRQEGLDVLRAAILGEADRHPLLLVVEDLHWGDPTTIEWIGRLLDAPAAPLLVLVTSRPGLEAPWLRLVQDLALDRLDFPATVELISDVGRRAGLSGDVARTIAERADGVPLFAEELTRAVIAADGAAERIPTSLYGCLMARLDRHEAARAVAQLAATVGRRFELDLLSALGELDEQTLGAGLARLREDGVVSAADSGAWEFRHTLIQQAALDSLLRERQRRYHRRIAETLLGEFGETAAAVPERVARHLEYAGETQAAIGQWHSAGMLALQRSALQEASSDFERALALVAELPETRERAQLELGLRVHAPLPLVATQGWTVPAVRAHYERAAALCAEVEGAPQLIPAMLGLITFRIVNGQMAEAVELGTEQLAVAERLGDPGLVLEVETELGNCCFYLGRFAEARERLARAAELYEPEHHHVHAHMFGRDPYPVGQVHVAMAAAAQGDRPAAHAAIERARAHVTRYRHPFSEAWVQIAAGVAHFIMGEHDAMLDCVEQAAAQSIAEGFPNWQAQANVHAGWVRARRGEPGAAERARAGIAMWESGGAVIMRPSLLAEVAEAIATTGDLDAASAVLEDAFAWLRRSGDRWAEPELQRVRAVLALRTGDQAAAREAIQEGLASARSTGAAGLAARLDETLATFAVPS
jgi:class 3 adenylate cyclase/tetratricopeptide (TPR) repeat protein